MENKYYIYILLIFFYLLLYMNLEHVKTCNKYKYVIKISIHSTKNQ